MGPLEKRRFKYRRVLRGIRFYSGRSRYFQRLVCFGQFKHGTAKVN